MGRTVKARFRALDYEPVIPEVYHAFKCCGKNPIIEPTESFDERKLSSEELEILMNVYLVCKTNKKPSGVGMN